MRLRGLQAKFLALVAVALVLAVLALGTLLQRQWAMQREMLELSQQSIRALVLERLRVQAIAVGTGAADTLVNPLYHFDLEAIGRIVRDLLGQPDVASVVVYDPDGAILHDGSDDIARYGQAMDDEDAAAIVASTSLHLRSRGDVFDVAAPIMLGDQRLGGVRIGYSLASVHRYEERANATLAGRIDALGQRYLAGIALLLALALVLGLGISAIMQRTMIRPIRRLAHAAREIEAGNFATPLPGRDGDDEIGELVQAFARMTEGLGRHDRDIRRIANTDALTGLANRRAFRERLDALIAAHRDGGDGFAVMFADMDDFKRVNDSFGHDVGDELLCRFADRFRAAVEADAGLESMLARLGGDEFVLLAQVAPDSTGSLRGGVSTFATSLIDTLGKPLAIEGHALAFGVSIGIALFPEDARDASQLMKNGDLAMYEAKRAGKNRFRFYAPGMEATLSPPRRLPGTAGPETPGA